MSVIDPMMESKHHLPECTLPKGHGDCICGELRAAEQRVTSDFAKYLRHMVDDDKFAAGVQAARDAVANVPVLLVDVRFNPDDASRYVGAVNVMDALAAIDALLGESNG